MSQRTLHLGRPPADDDGGYYFREVLHQVFDYDRAALDRMSAAEVIALNDAERERQYRKHAHDLQEAWKPKERRLPFRG